MYVCCWEMGNLVTLAFLFLLDVITTGPIYWKLEFSCSSCLVSCVGWKREKLSLTPGSWLGALCWAVVLLRNITLAQTISIRGGHPVMLMDGDKKWPPYNHVWTQTNCDHRPNHKVTTCPLSWLSDRCCFPSTSLGLFLPPSRWDYSGNYLGNHRILLAHSGHSRYNCGMDLLISDSVLPLLGPPFPILLAHKTYLRCMDVKDAKPSFSPSPGLASAAGRGRRDSQHQLSCLTLGSGAGPLQMLTHALRLRDRPGRRFPRGRFEPGNI